MARLSASARRRHERELAAAFGAVLARQATRVAAHLRHHSSLTAAGDEDSWWDETQAEDENDHVLRPAIAGAAAASGAAVASAYGATYTPGTEVDAVVAARAKQAAQQTANTTRKVFADLIDDGDEDEAADRIEKYGDAAGRASLVGMMEIAAAVLMGGRAAIAFLADRPDEDRVAAKTWVLSPDHDTEDECDDNDGLTIAETDEWPGGDPGDLHFGCLVGPTRVEVPVALERTMSRWYSGPLVKVHTVGGREFTATPNHPVMTPNGWMPAGLLMPGDDLVCGSSCQRFVVGDPDDDENPPTIEQVVRAFNKAGSVVAASVPVAAEDFHGDGMGSEVAVIGSDRQLWGHLQPSLAEQCPQEMLGRGDVEVGQVALSALGHPGSLLEGMDAPCCDMGGLGSPPIFLGGPLGSVEPHGLAASPSLHSSLIQPPVDHPTADAMATSERIHGLAGEVRDRERIGHGLPPAHLADRHPMATELLEDESLADPEVARYQLAVLSGGVPTDSVLKVEPFDATTHVFNLQTATGWYLAEGVMVSNCLCDEDYSLVDPSELTASASSHAPDGGNRTIAAMAFPVPTPPVDVEAIAAAAIASHSTPTTDEPWDGQAAERALSNDDGASVYREAYAWVNPAGDPDKKNSYWGHHHMVDEEGAVGAANVAACQRAIKALNGSRGASGVPAGDRQTTYNHLHAHLRDAGVEDIPALKASAAPELVRIPREVMDKVRRYCDKHGIALSLSEAITAAPDGSITVEGGGPWHAVATVEGVAVAGAMGKREFAPGSLKTRALPLPLMLQREASHGSGQPGGAVICGAITESERDGARILNAGVFDTSADGTEAERLVGAQMMRFVSIDAEVLEYELVMDEGMDILDAIFGGGEILERYTDANQIGLTIVPFPAFAGCVITPADMDLPTTSYDSLDGVENPDGPLAVAASAGAAWAATSEHPPAAWFRNPELPRLTHSTVSPDGRVYGHVAPWGQSHIGYSSWRPAPRSPSEYRFFLTGRTEVVDEDGNVSEVATGRITLGTTHAESRQSYAEAVSHYDNTGLALADVVCGEDEFGIWFSGALRPSATREQVRVFKASDVSGDWRPISGNFDMIGILTVNAAGFPIPGSLTAAAAVLVPDEGHLRIGLDEEGRELSLVAAGVIRQGPATAMAEMARRIVELEAIVAPLRSLALETVAAQLSA